jgi:Rrf2 family protein
MKISTKTHHALRMMLDFAMHGNENFISLKDTAQRLGVSKPYLEQIMIQISKTDFLIAARGATGGYKLARTPDRYTVGEILRVMEGDLVPTVANNVTEYSDAVDFMAKKVWDGLERVTMTYLDNLPLQDVLDGYQNVVGFDYSI